MEEELHSCQSGEALFPGHSYVKLSVHSVRWEVLNIKSECLRLRFTPCLIQKMLEMSQILTHTHALKRTHTHTYICTHTGTHTHTHIHIRSVISLSKELDFKIYLINKKFTSIHFMLTSSYIYLKKKKKILHLSLLPPAFSFSHLSLSLSLCLFLKSAYVLRGILLSPDTNLHKVHAIIGSREANYFPGNITLPLSFIIYFLCGASRGLLGPFSQIC